VVKHPEAKKVFCALAEEMGSGARLCVGITLSTAVKDYERLPKTVACGSSLRRTRRSSLRLQVLYQRLEVWILNRIGQAHCMAALGGCGRDGVLKIVRGYPPNILRHQDRRCVPSCVSPVAEWGSPLPCSSSAVSEAPDASRGASSSGTLAARAAFA
jgi:hypothetical protein